MKNIYILDTSVIAHDPTCLYAFPNSKIVLHISILTELDKIKSYSGEVGRNARIFIKTIDEIIKNKEGTQFKLDNGSLLILDTDDFVSELQLGDIKYTDNKLIQYAKLSNKYLKNDHKVILVSNDINMRVRARAFGIHSQEFCIDEKRGIDDIYSGIVNINNPELGILLREQKSLSCKDYEIFSSILPNECIIFEDSEKNVISLGRKKREDILLIKEHTLFGGIKTRNKEQAFAADLLLDPDISLVSLVGFAGTGKTLLAVAAGLELLFNGHVENIRIYKSLKSLNDSNDIGFLPGDYFDKIFPSMGSVIDSFDVILNSKNKKKKGQKPQNNNGNKPSNSPDDWKNKFSQLLGQFADCIHLEALTYIRGRSIPNSYIILDEAQNCTKLELKSLISRLGSGSKIIISGDVEQIDSKNLDAINNGLTRTIEAFKDSDLSANIKFIHGERSALATEAAARM